MLGWLAIAYVCGILTGVGLHAAMLAMYDRPDEELEEPTDEPKKQPTLKPPKSWHHRFQKK